MHIIYILILKKHVNLSTNHNLYEEKGQPKPRNRVEALLLPSLTLYHQAELAHCELYNVVYFFAQCILIIIYLYILILKKMFICPNTLH